MGANTYAAVGNKEDLSDIITNISPTDTPLYSSLGKASAIATYHEWLEDDLGDDPKDNAVTEGATYVVDSPGTRTRKGNYTQIMRRGYGVTGTQEIVSKHGVKSEIGYHMTKAMKLIALDMERALIRNDSQVAGDTETARRMGGIPYWIATNAVDNSGSERDLTLALINSTLESIWGDGGSPNTLYVSPRNKRIVGTFTDSATKYMQEGTTKIGSRIDVIESDFGVLNIKVDRWMPNDSVFILDPSLWKIAALRPFKTEDLPKTADKIEKVIIGEYTLEARAEQGNGMIEDLNGDMPS